MRHHLPALEENNHHRVTDNETFPLREYHKLQSSAIAVVLNFGTDSFDQHGSDHSDRSSRVALPFDSRSLCL